MSISCSQQGQTWQSALCESLYVCAQKKESRGEAR